MLNLTAVSSADDAYYALLFDSPYDPYVSTYTCGTAGQKAGLALGYLVDGDVPRIPYGKRTEVPVTFATNGLCNTFVNVNLMIIATCEAPSPNPNMTQYETIPNIVPVQINYNNYSYAQNSIFPFRVSWLSSRRLSESEEEVSVDHSRNVEGLTAQMATQREELLKEIAELRVDKKELRDQMERQIDAIEAVKQQQYEIMKAIQSLLVEKTLVQHPNV